MKQKKRQFFYRGNGIVYLRVFYSDRKVGMGETNAIFKSFSIIKKEGFYDKRKII